MPKVSLVQLPWHPKIWDAPVQFHCDNDTTALGICGHWTPALIRCIPHCEEDKCAKQN